MVKSNFEQRVVITRGGPKMRCDSCFELKPLASFESSEDATYHTDCQPCRRSDEWEPLSTREPLVGERICDGFEMLGVEDE